MKKKRIKSTVPIYLISAQWLLLGLFCPGMLLKEWFLVLALLLSAVVYISAELFTMPLYFKRTNKRRMYRTPIIR